MSGDAVATYHQEIVRLLTTIAEDERDSIDRAARLMAEAVAGGRTIHVFGTGGHSYMAAEELFYRTGGLAAINAILDPGVSLGMGALRSTFVERLPGYAAGVLAYHNVGADDVLIVANAYGINSCTIDAAIEGKKRGARVIAVTSKTFSSFVPQDHPARHPGKKNLFELPEVDVVVDNHMPVGDALVSFEGRDEPAAGSCAEGSGPHGDRARATEKAGPSSTMLNSFTLNCLVLRCVEHLLDMGVEPPIWRSANMPGGEEANARHIARYRGRLRYL